MSDAFDPYYQWLGIPPEEQPPDHYRLLGIKLFEQNPDVIEAASDRQMGHLRTYQGGRHSDLSQKLLNEVAAAKVCLLRPQQKAAYDKELKALAADRTTPQPAPAGESPRPAPMPRRPTGAVPEIDFSRASRAASHKKTAWQLPAAIATGAVVVLALLVVLILSRDKPQAAHDDEKNRPKAEAARKSGEKGEKTVRPVSEPPAETPPWPEDPPSLEPPSRPLDPPPDFPPRPDLPQPEDPPPPEDPPLPIDPTPPPESTPGTALPNDTNPGEDGPAAEDPPGSNGSSAAREPLGEVCRIAEHTAAVNDVTVSFDGRYLATAGADGVILIVEAATSKVIRRLRHDVAGFTCVAISPDGESVLTGCDEKYPDERNVLIWDFATGQLRTRLQGRQRTTSATISADGRNMVTMHPAGIADLRRVADPGQCFPLVAHDQAEMGWDAAISPDGEYLATVGGDGKAFVWYIGDNIRPISRMQINQAEARSVAFSPDGQYILCGNSDRSLSLWSDWKAEDRWQRAKSFTGHQDQITCVAYSPDGKLVASGSLDKTVRIWKAADGKQVRVLSGHTAGVTAVAFLPDGPYLVSGSSDHTVRIWRIAAGPGRWPAKR